jgi:uncharacterized protein
VASIEAVGHAEVGAYHVHDGLRAAVSAEDANFVARLMDHAPDGSAREMTVGYLRAGHREGHVRVVPVPPGEFLDYELVLQTIHWRVQAGHRLRLSLSSGDVPALVPDVPAGTITVALGEGLCSRSRSFPTDSRRDELTATSGPEGPERQA